jgi:hypothetical protein
VSDFTFTNTKSPASFVTTGADLVFCDSLIRMTVAPGITPPCGSFTVPPIDPVVICADAMLAPSRQTAAITPRWSHAFSSIQLPSAC